MKIIEQQAKEEAIFQSVSNVARREMKPIQLSAASFSPLALVHFGAVVVWNSLKLARYMAARPNMD